MPLVLAKQPYLKLYDLYVLLLWRFWEKNSLVFHMMKRA